MDLRILPINFEVSDDLKKFVTLKVEKLNRFNDNIIDVDVQLKKDKSEVHPDTLKDKDVSIRLKLRNGEAFASKVSDTFEEAVDLCVEAIEKQIIKRKEKK